MMPYGVRKFFAREWLRTNVSGLSRVMANIRGIPHNANMSLLQLIRQDSAQGSRTIEALPNPDQLPFRAFEDRSHRAVVLGSLDLLLLAGQLTALGFRTSDVTITDLRYEALPEQDSALLKDQLVRHLNSGDSDRIENYVGEEMQGYLVSAIQLLRRASKASLRITQNGGVRLQSDDVQRDLADLSQAISDSQ